MATSSTKRPLQAEKPKVVLLGDCIVDYHIYDKRAEDADQWLAWTSPLSRDDWHYAAGFDMRPCLAGAAAIHAMLWANDIAVAGNSFPIDSALRAPPESGSIFIIRRRANAGKTKQERTRAYLMNSPDRTWAQIAASTSNAKSAIDRDETWRAAVSLLSKSGVTYVDTFDGIKHKFKKDDVKVVCFWDVGRGFFLAPGASGWKAQQDALFRQYKDLCSGDRKPPILIRTSDPDHFAHFLKKLAGDRGTPPNVILVCAQAQIYDGDLRGSGTWSGVWQQTYDYLSQPKMNYLHDDVGQDWRFNVVIPVYEDGVVWIGPKCWPIEQPDHKEEYLRDDKRPIGKLFLVPGMQPGLSDFEDHNRIIGVHALLTYSILEHLTDTPANAHIDDAIKIGLMRCRRLRSHGYCDPDELLAIEDSGRSLHINYPREIWKNDSGGRRTFCLKSRIRKPTRRQDPTRWHAESSFPMNRMHAPGNCFEFFAPSKRR